MTVKKHHISRQKFLILLFVTIFIMLISSLPTSYNCWIDDLFTNLQFKIRGSRQLSDDILFVFIGPEDVHDLGGWPISRDYYGYMTHILKQGGARVIAFDMLFEKPEPLYREFDQILTQFIESAGNVCLPMAFGELQKNQSENRHSNLYIGSQPAMPMSQLSKAAAAIGFSNFGNEINVRKVPLVVLYDDSTYFSFGTELARLFLGINSELLFLQNHLVIENNSEGRIDIPLDKIGRLKLNHFGGINNLNSISFMDLLQAFESAPDSLEFSNKLILVGLTAPAISIYKSTPLTNSLPASLVHATVAENIIHQNFLKDIPFYLQWVLILALVLLMYALWESRWLNHRNWIGFVILAVFWLISITAFTHLHWVLPLFYPSVALIFTDFYLKIFLRYELNTQEIHRKKLLEDHIKEKEEELGIAREKMKKYQDELQLREKHSDQLKQIANGQQETILQLENELRDLETYIVPEQPTDLPEFSEMIHSPESELKKVLELIGKIRSDDIPVLIIGETGTGKEMVARAIHRTSPRKDKSFVAVNCGALTETLLESELFGHEKGSFTGAHSRRRGRFEIADGGTIFLDEITETSLSFQAKFLRVLQEGVFERVGGEQSIKVNVRVIAASNKDLKMAMKGGNFREDLFYRLNGFPIILPALRERLDDIPILADHFLKKHNYPPVKKFSDQAMIALVQYSWPGNVRELENIVRRAALLAQSEKRELIRLSDLPEEIQTQQNPAHVTEKFQSLDRQILAMLRSFRFSHSAISKTAKALGNRDRGTVTEYFRGICFQGLVKTDFNIVKAAQDIAKDEGEEITQKVEKKIQEYIKNLYPLPDLQDQQVTNLHTLRQFKGLPKKYHDDLIQIIYHLKQELT